MERFSVRGPHNEVPYVAWVTYENTDEGQVYSRPMLMWATSDENASQMSAANNRGRNINLISIRMFRADANHHLGAQRNVPLSEINS